MKHALLLALACTVLCAPAVADPALARAKNCMNCHALENKLVGPSYRSVAARYAGDKAAVDRLAQKIRKGGAGVWGPVSMPANERVSEAEARALATWVLSMR